MTASAAQQEKVARRREDVLRMRLAGMSPRQIAEEVRRKDRDEARRGHRRPALAGYDAHAVVMDCRRALEEQRDHARELVGLYLTMELARLDSYTRTAESLMRQAMGAGDRWGALRAMDRLFAASARRDQLLGVSRVTAAAQDAAAGEAPSGGVTEADGLDEVGRKRAERRAAYDG